MTTSARRRRPARLPAAAALLSLALVPLVAQPLTAVAPASAAAVPDLLKDSEFALANLPAYPATLVAGGGEASYHALTADGTGIQEYGIATDRGPVTDAVEERWADDEPYPRLAGLAGARYAAVGQIDGDGSVDAAYLAGNELTVTGSQEDGFPVRAVRTNIPNPADVRGLVLVERGTSTRNDQAASEALVLLQRATTFDAYMVLDDSLFKVDSLVDGRGRAWSVPNLVASYHRPVHETYATDLTTAEQRTRATSFALLAADGARLRLQQATARVEVEPLRVVIDTTTVHDELRGPNGSSHTWGAGALSYDWDSDGRMRTLAAARASSDTAYTWRDGQVTVDPEGASVCSHGTEAVPGLATLSFAGTFVTACSTVQRNSRGADQLVQAISLRDRGNGLPAWQYTDQEVAGQDVVLRPQPQVVLPCMSFLAAAQAAQMPQTSCSNGFSNLTNRTLGHVALNTYVSAGPSGALSPYLVATSRDSATNPNGGSDVVSDLTVRATANTSATPALALPLPSVPTAVRLTVDKGSRRLAQSNPVPVAFLAAPPQVAGAGQDADAPAFATTRSSSTTEGESTESSFGVGVGVDWEDPTGAYGVEVEAKFNANSATGKSLTHSISTSEAFNGLLDADTVVYNSLQLLRYDGTITTSSTGVGLGTSAQVDVPNGGTTSAASVSNLAKRFPKSFGVNGSERPVLDAVFGHTVGDPGSYLSYGTSGEAVDEYCDGAISPSGSRDLDLPDSLVPPNPFTTKPPVAPAQPDVLVSDRHEVLVGTGNSEGATFEIGQDQATSRVQSYGTEIGVKGRVNYVTGSVSTGFSWSREWEQSLGAGVGFASYVGHIPGENEFLEREAYNWRSFMCQKTVPTSHGDVTAWVLDYTVDGYEGSGGLEPMSEIELTGPTGSAVEETARPQLDFTQDTGTVRSYDVRLEAVGATDRHDLAITYPDPRTSNDTRPDDDSVVPTRDLLPGQLYRWKVTATDFFGNVEASDYEFFRTDGAPQAAMDTDRQSVSAGEVVTFRNRTTTTDGAAVTYTWDFGDGTPVVTTTDRSDVTHTYEKSGSFVARLTAGKGAAATSDRLRMDVQAVTAPDSYTGAEDTVLTSGDRGVLANDRGSSSVRLARDAAHGTLVLATDGTFTYTPAPDFCGQDTFAYTVGSTAQPEQVTIAVGCTPDAPVVGADSASTVEDTWVDLDLLANDTDADGPRERLRLVSATPGHGTLVAQTDGRFRYTPAKDWCGTDVFDQEVTDGTTDVGSTVTVEVRCVNDAPVTTADTLRVTEDATGTVRPTANDTDADGDGLQVLLDDPQHGRLVELPLAPGTFTYVPDADWCGTERVAQTVSDGAAEVRATLELVVDCVDDAPVLGPDAARVVEDGRVALDPLANDHDADGETLRLGSAAAAHGTVTRRADGTLDYAPAADFCGSDTVEHVVTDGHGEVSGTVDVVVDCVNDRPVARDDVATVTEDGSLVVPVVANDTDADDASLVPAQAGGAAHGVVTLQGGALTYRPARDYCGTDSFGYRARDAAGAVSEELATVSVTVTCTNDAPRARADHFWRVLREDGSVAKRRLKVLRNDRDVESGRIRAEMVQQPAVGRVRMRANGLFRYLPPAGPVPAEVQFRYRACDAAGACSRPKRVTLYLR